MPAEKLGNDIADPRIVVDHEDGFLSLFAGFEHHGIRHGAIKCAQVLARLCR
jgi:hypothetical protein